MSPSYGMTLDEYIEWDMARCDPDGPIRGPQTYLWKAHHAPIGVYGLYALINEEGRRQPMLIPSRHITEACGSESYSDHVKFGSLIKEGTAPGGIYYGWNDVTAVWLPIYTRIDDLDFVDIKWVRCITEEEMILKLEETDRRNECKTGEVYLEV